nr:unnamed protein product [Callosobruchus analis]
MDRGLNTFHMRRTALYSTSVPMECRIWKNALLGYTSILR